MGRVVTPTNRKCPDRIPVYWGLQKEVFIFQRKWKKRVCSVEVKFGADIIPVVLNCADTDIEKVCDLAA